jgi:hypothetical protein
MLSALDAALDSTIESPLAEEEVERALQALRARAALQDASEDAPQ